MNGFPQVLRHFAYTNGRPQTVKILVAMPHNQDIVRITDNFPQGLGHNTGLDPGVFFHRLGLASVKLDLPAHMNGCLVAAAPQSQVKTGLGTLAQGSY